MQNRKTTHRPNAPIARHTGDGNLEGITTGGRGAHGRMAVGGKHGSSHLLRSEVCEIRPNLVTVVGAKLSTGYKPASDTLNRSAISWRNWTCAIHPLIDKAGCGFDGLRKRNLRVQVRVFF